MQKDKAARCFALRLLQTQRVRQRNPNRHPCDRVAATVWRQGSKSASSSGKCSLRIRDALGETNWSRMNSFSSILMLMGSELALRTVLIGRLSVTQPTEIVWVVTRLYHQNLFYILCVVPEGEEFGKYQPVFVQIIRSVELRERWAVSIYHQLPAVTVDTLVLSI